ncbi:MAG TPA: hypothetical protein VFZ31_08700 [Vicinamibacterales bacterium]
MLTFVAPAEAAGADRIETEVAIVVSSGSHSVTRIGEPVRIGVPLPEGLCFTEAACRLRDPYGKPVPLQAHGLDQWRDGSIRWLLIDFHASVRNASSAEYRLTFGGGPMPPAPAAPLRVTQDHCSIAVDTGAAHFQITRGGGFPFNDAALTAVDGEGELASAVVSSARVVDHGQLRCSVIVEGAIGGTKGEPLVQVEAELQFVAASPTVKVDLTVRNPRKAEHPGGYWDLGSRGSVFLKDLSVTFALPGSALADIQCWPEIDMRVQSAAPFELYQDSSGGANWRSSNHVNRDRVVPNRFNGYQLTTGSMIRTGMRATPLVAVSKGARTIAVTMPEFWQNFPKALEASDNAIVLRLFPKQCAGVHEIQGGEQKTHTFFVALGRDFVTTVPLDWCRAPMRVSIPASWSAKSQAVPYLSTASETAPARRALVNAALDGEHSFARKREIIDEYGWRNFGELYADHEAVFTKQGQPPLVSHYNNQYDAIAGFGTQYLQTGDPRWLQAMHELARHVVDIDIYHCDRDKAAYNHGLFWHTFHYVDADTSTHRSYPRASNVGGGGPAAEQNYTTGLMLHYFLTGDRRSRDAAVGLARFVIAMDDGRRTVFKWLARGHTGLATASGSIEYHGPGRSAGNSLNALIDAHRLTGEAEFLAKAEEIIRRCIHPADDIAARELLDAERKWFYTVFLQALGKYLDYKIELRALDDTYAYARESLLHYARWMAVHEYPYLDKPEILEYPNETWAAQDLRKSEVFLFAARHAMPVDRGRFLERAAFFHDYSLQTLGRMPTATLTRPLVLMLRLGGMHDYFSRVPHLRAPEPVGRAADFGTPRQFVPQKITALKRAKRLAGVCAAMAVAAVTWVLL